MCVLERERERGSSLGGASAAAAAFCIKEFA